MERLRWPGSLEAQRQHEEAAALLVPRKKLKKSARKSRAQKRRERRARLACKQQTSTQEPTRQWVDYPAYLVSPWWKAKRLQKLKSCHFRCERCPSRATQVHHKHYRSLGREKNTDLEAVCRPCHEAEHECLIQCNAHLSSIARSLFTR